MNPRGVLVCDGRKFDVVDVRLRDGEFRVIGTADGPMPAGHGPVTLFGEDGLGCWQGGELSWPEVPADAIVKVTATVKITEVKVET